MNLSNRTASVYRGIAYAALSTYLTACEAHPPRSYPIAVRVLDDDASPVAGACVTANRQSLGTTNSDGMLEIQLKGEEGESLSLSIHCPAGYRASTETRTVVLRSFSRLSNGPTSKGPEIRWRCLPTERLAALVVRTPGQPDLPITVHGREIARTGRDGVAHALLRLAPGTNFRVALDTSTHSELRPQSPERVFQVGDRDMIFIFDQQFAVRRRPARRKPAGPKRYIPYRIQ